MSEKCPYKDDTPEWQLWQNMMSQDALVRSYTEDSERYLKMAEKARNKKDAFKDALEKLGATP